MSKTPRRALDAVLHVFAGRLDEVTEAMVTAYREHIPAYRGMSREVLADVRNVSRRNLDLLTATLIQDRLATEQDLAPLTASARERVHVGASLDDLLHAYRLGMSVAWEAIVEAAQTVEGGGEAALEIAGRVIRFVDQVSTAVAHAYLLETETAAQDKEEQHRQVLDSLLRGDLDRATALADGLGIVLTVPCQVAAVQVPGPAGAVTSAARRLRHSLVRQHGLVVRRGGNVLVLLPAASAPAAVLDVLKDSASALVAWADCESGTLAEQVAEVQTVLGLSVGRSGLVRLRDVLADALVTQAGGRTGQLLAACAAALDESMLAESQVAETVLSFVAHNGSINAVARELHVHRNTVLYRLNRVHEMSGLDPHHFTDLFLLWASLRARAIEAGDRRAGRSPSPSPVTAETRTAD